MPPKSKTPGTKEESYRFSRLEDPFVLPSVEAFQEALEQKTKGTRAAVRSLLANYKRFTFDATQEVQGHMKGVSLVVAHDSHKRHLSTMKQLDCGLPVGPDRLFDAYLIKTQEAPVQVVWKKDEPSSEDAIVAAAFVEHLDALLKRIDQAQPKKPNRSPYWR